jgi:hypothetical protein
MFQVGNDRKMNDTSKIQDVASKHNIFTISVQVKYNCPATTCRRLGGYEIWLLLILDISTRWSEGKRQALAALYPRGKYPI